MWFYCFLIVWLTLSSHETSASGKIQKRECEGEKIITDNYEPERTRMLVAMRNCCHYYYGSLGYHYDINMDLKYSPKLDCLLRFDYPSGKRDRIPSWTVFQAGYDVITKKNPSIFQLIESAVQEKKGWLCESASRNKGGHNDIFACTYFYERWGGIYQDYFQRYGCVFYAQKNLKNLP